MTERQVIDGLLAGTLPWYAASDALREIGEEEKADQVKGHQGLPWWWLADWHGRISVKYPDEATDFEPTRIDVTRFAQHVTMHSSVGLHKGSRPPKAGEKFGPVDVQLDWGRPLVRVREAFVMRVELDATRPIVLPLHSGTAILVEAQSSGPFMESV